MANDMLLRIARAVELLAASDDDEAALVAKLTAIRDRIKGNTNELVTAVGDATPAA